MTWRRRIRHDECLSFCDKLELSNVPAACSGYLMGSLEKTEASTKGVLPLATSLEWCKDCAELKVAGALRAAHELSANFCCPQQASTSVFRHSLPDE